MYLNQVLLFSTWRIQWTWYDRGGKTKVEKCFPVYSNNIMIPVALVSFFIDNSYYSQPICCLVHRTALDNFVISACIITWWKHSCLVGFECDVLVERNWDWLIERRVSWVQGLQLPLGAATRVKLSHEERDAEKPDAAILEIAAESSQFVHDGKQLGVLWILRPNLRRQ